jgi:hypothetical protein
LRVAGDGEAVSDHLAAARRGRVTQEEEDYAPPLAEEVEHLWAIWRDLHSARGSGFSSNPISWSDLDAYARLLDEPLEPWEARAIRAVDDAYIASLADKGEVTGEPHHG